MLLAMATYVLLSGVVALYVSALGEPELSRLRGLILRKWAVYLAIGAFILIWLTIAQDPLILP